MSIFKFNLFKNFERFDNMATLTMLYSVKVSNSLLFHGFLSFGNYLVLFTKKMQCFLNAQK